MNRSSTGPQMATLQYPGDDTSRASGFPLPTSPSSDCPWNGHTGSWVQIGLTPRGSAVVGDGTFGSGVPGSGTAANSCGSRTSTDRRCGPPGSWASMVHAPVVGNVVWSG